MRGCRPVLTRMPLQTKDSREQHHEKLTMRELREAHSKTNAPASFIFMHQSKHWLDSKQQQKKPFNACQETLRHFLSVQHQFRGGQNEIRSPQVQGRKTK